LIALFTTALLITAEPTIAAGSIQVGRGVTEPVVWLIAKDNGNSLRLSGDAIQELRNLQSAKVELLGLTTDGGFVVQSYRIIEVAGGARPLAVGTLVHTGEAGLALGTDEGAPIPLNASSRLRAALSTIIGAKLWIVGDRLLSGEMKVTRYGVLREARRLQGAATQGTPEQVPQSGVPAAAPATKQAQP
jgi:hypothetical protein